MATYYIDFVNGNDANAGTSWGTAWKTPITGSTAARIAPGDTIKMSKSPAKVSIGNGTWTSIANYDTPTTTLTISDATNASPIQITTTAPHGLSTGDIVQVNAVTGNTAANGTWIVTNTGSTTFTLDGSSGNGAYNAGTGIAQNANYRAVKLASNTSTKLISDVYLGWTSANGSTVTADTASVKSTPEARNIASPAGAANNTRYAYYTLPATTDFSAFTHITFWIRASLTTMTNNTWKICLCSDTTGTTIVDEFLIPRVTSNNQNVSLVVAKNGGGNLGSAIQSVAVYSGSTAISNFTITIDNINACTATGLNLQSIISPVSGDQDVYDNYPIAAILDNIILLDNAHSTPNTITTNLRGYSGTGGTFTTYYRNPIDFCKENSLAYTTICPGDVTEPGTFGNVITYSGGWDTSTDTQDGLTVLYVPGASVGWTLKDFNAIEYCGVSRGTRGFGPFQQGRAYSGQTFSNCFAVGGFNGIQFAGPSVLTGPAYPNVINNCGVTNTQQPGFVSQAQPLKVDTLKIKNCVPYGTNVGPASAFVFNGANSSFKNVEIINTRQGAFEQLAQQTSFVNCSAKWSGSLLTSNVGGGYFYNTTSDSNNAVFTEAINGNGGDTYFEKISYSASTVFNSPNNDSVYSNIYLKDINGDTSDWANYSYYATVTRNLSVTHSGSSSWQVSIQNPFRDANFPYTLPVAEVYCTANVSTTISIWMYLTNSSMAANLFVPGRQIAGVDNDVSTAANSATTGSWQQVSVNFTPTANGVIRVYANVWSTGASNEKVYLDDLTLPAGIATTNMETSLMGAPWVQNIPSVTAATQAYATVGL